MSDSDFNTPPWLLDLVRLLDPTRRIGLDPCSNAHSMVDATTAYTEVHNGLIQDWRGHGLVFMNPPHSMPPHNIEPWMEKAHLEFVVGGIDREDNPTRDAFCGLVPAKTDTQWFHRHASRMTAMCFLLGRPKFWLHGKEMPGPGKFPSLVLYHGQCAGMFKSIFGPHGWCP